VDPWYKKSEILYNQGHYDLAITCYDKILSINSNHFDLRAYESKAKALSKLKNFDEAIRYYKGILAAESIPDSKRTAILRENGLLLDRLGRINEARDCFKVALTINPEIAEKWYYEATDQEKRQLARYLEYVRLKIQESMDMQLALKWAPIDYQYIRLDPDNNNYSIKKDLIVPVDLQFYKNDKVDIESRWDTRNIRERLMEVKINQLIPVVYYAIAETESHYYILYSFYHADADTHPNDMEGCLVLLEKLDRSELLLGIITVAHYDFWLYPYKNNLLHKSGKEFTTNEQLEVEEEIDSQRPLIQQEKGNHGLYALGPTINNRTKILIWFSYLLGIYSDVIRFTPNEQAFYYSIESITKGKGTPYTPSFYYELVNILGPKEGLWERWRKRPNSTFAEDGKFHGGSANPPWLWKEKEWLTFPQDIDLGLMWQNPAELVGKLFRPGLNRKPFSTEYIRKMDGTMVPITNGSNVQTV
jgi:tetratricopeptide (TPR) repeat protein